MANTDPEALKAAAAAYAASNASLADYDPAQQEAKDRVYLSTTEDAPPRTLPAEPVTVSADANTAPAAAPKAAK